MEPDGASGQKNVQFQADALATEPGAQDVVIHSGPGAGERTGDDRWEMAAGPKPRLVLLHYTAPPIVGGVEQVIGEQARLFAERGYAVTVVAGRADAQAFAEHVDVLVLPELDPGAESNLKIVEALGADIVLPEFRCLQARIERALQPICAGNTLILAHNVLNYHLHFPLTAALHHLLDEGAIRRMIAWCHDVSRYVNPTSGSALRFGFPWELLRTCRSEVKYVAVSCKRQRSLAHVLGCPQDQIRIIPDGIDPCAFGGLGDETSQLIKNYELLQADLILLMPVRITRATNIKRALEIIGCLRDMGLRVNLVVTGPADPDALDGQAYLREVLALRHKLRLDRDVVLVSQDLAGTPGPLTVGPAMLAELYRICDLVLLTSNSEGFGLPVLEAGLSGRPIFTTDVPALEEFEPDSVFGIERGELAAQVAQRIREWAQQDTSYRLRRRVRRDYTWSEVYRRHIEPLLQECAAPCGVQA